MAKEKRMKKFPAPGSRESNFVMIKKIAHIRKNPPKSDAKTRVRFPDDIL